jgi:hypothetical protein
MMVEKKARKSSGGAQRKGKSASTRAGSYVREEMEHLKEGKHGSRVKSPKQAVAVGLSKARRAGVKVKPPAKGKAASTTRQKATRETAKGKKSGTTRATSKTTKSSTRSGSRKPSKSRTRG